MTKNVDFIGHNTFESIVKQNYNIKEGVLTGLNFYDDLHKKKTSGCDQRDQVRQFEEFLSEVFFEGKRVELTSSSDNPPTILFSVDNVEHPIHHIGDGIQMLILLLFPIFTADENTWFFIEEPETHLHPGLQRIFIETLLNHKSLKNKKIRYFFTTHSNHFIDASFQTDEVSVFQFQKENPEKFTIKNVKPSRETLDLLGVNNSSVFMANASIWVEGPTDRKYISKFLKLYCKQNTMQHLKEDLDFSFFEYGGNLIAHYLFDEDFEELYTDQDIRVQINSFALSNKIYLLADNDNAEGKKLERREKLVEHSVNEKNFKYQNTNYLEIENLLPVKVIKDFMLKLADVSESEKIKAITFDRNDYTSIGLGEFIESIFKVNEIANYKKFKDDSGTLKSSYKTKLNELVINGDYSYNDLICDNVQLHEIVENLYHFIKPRAN